MLESGQTRQPGSRGVQTKAPSSISAWLKVPAPTAGTSRSAACQRRSCVEAVLRFSSIASSRARTR